MYIRVYRDVRSVSMRYVICTDIASMGMDRLICMRPCQTCSEAYHQTCLASIFAVCLYGTLCVSAVYQGRFLQIWKGERGAWYSQQLPRKTLVFKGNSILAVRHVSL